MAILKHRCVFRQATTADVYAQALGENHVGGRGIFVPSADGPFQDLIKGAEKPRTDGELKYKERI